MLVVEAVHVVGHEIKIAVDLDVHWMCTGKPLECTSSVNAGFSATQRTDER